MNTVSQAHLLLPTTTANSREQKSVSSSLYALPEVPTQPQPQTPTRTHHLQDLAFSLLGIGSHLPVPISISMHPQSQSLLQSRSRSLSHTRRSRPPSTDVRSKKQSYHLRRFLSELPDFKSLVVRNTGGGVARRRRKKNVVLRRHVRRLERSIRGAD